MTMPDDRLQRLANGPVAIVGQSGGLAMAIKRSLEERGIDAGSVVTSGNQAGLSTADYIAYYAMNDDIRVIVCLPRSGAERRSLHGGLPHGARGRQADRA